MTTELNQWFGPVQAPSSAELGDRLAASQLVKVYALGIDMRDYDLTRSAFAADAVAEGSAGAGPIDDYLPKVFHGAAAFEATQHNITNQHVTLNGDEALVWSYAIAVHQHAQDSGRGHLIMGVQYRDQCRRFPGGWLIAARKVVVQWVKNG